MCLHVSYQLDPRLRGAEKNSHRADAGKQKIEVADLGSKPFDRVALKQETKEKHPDHRLHQGEAQQHRAAQRLDPGPATDGGDDPKRRAAHPGSPFSPRRRPAPGSPRRVGGSSALTPVNPKYAVARSGSWT